jgi:hypothetical protein
MFEHQRDCEVTTSNAVACSLEQAVSAREPASCRGGLATEEMAMADPPSTARCRGDVPGVEVGVERVLERVCVLLVTTQLRGPGQQLKVWRRKRLLLIAAA